MFLVMIYGTHQVEEGSSLSEGFEMLELTLGNN